MEQAKKAAEQKKAQEEEAQRASKQTLKDRGDAQTKEQQSATPSADETPKQEQASAPASTGSVSGGQFQSMGVIVDGGTRFTYYNLPMGGVEAMHGTSFHNRGDGVLVDAEGYVVVAYGMSGYGQIISTPLGQGKVYDHCPTTNTADIAVVF